MTLHHGIFRDHITEPFTCTCGRVLLSDRGDGERTNGANNLPDELEEKWETTATEVILVIGIVPYRNLRNGMAGK
jgi:hypothetical protein